jgi:hypothetical protein
VGLPSRQRRGSSALSPPGTCTVYLSWAEITQTSVVEFREQLKLVGLLFVMVDEERRLVRCDHCLIFSIDAMDSALSVLREGTLLFSKFSSK